MRAFLEKINNEWLDDFVYVSKQPLLDMSVDVIPFESALIEGNRDLLKHSPNKKDVIFASVDCCRSFFGACGIDVPSYIGYPDELQSFMKRKVDTLTMESLDLIIDEMMPVFVKPKNDVKLFTGCVIEDRRLWNTFKMINPLERSTELLVCEPVEIISEYRCFVHKKELKGIRHYAGDFRVFPDARIVDEMVVAYAGSNVSYSLDVAVLKDNSTVLVEVNDAWALGSYGFDPKIYVRMVLDRFREITG